MRNRLTFLAALVVGSALLAGCAKTEKKLGRGLNNAYEIVRLGEARRTVEQTALFEGPDVGYTYGVIHGLDRSLARTGIGLYEVITCAFPSYDQPFADSYPDVTVSPDSYKPTLMEDANFATDTNLGFSGGDLTPFVPGSRFRVFETH